MNSLVQNRMDDLIRICEAHFVERIALFGSATRLDFDVNSSDLDFVVEFNSTVPELGFAKNFFSLLNELKELFQLPVDLLTFESLRNPVMIQEVNRTKVELYAA